MGLLYASLAEAVAPTAVSEYQLVKPWQDNQVRVYWKARVRAAGGQFILLVGDRSVYSEVARVEANPCCYYQVNDAALLSGPRTYQLRYQEPSGKQHVLGAIQVTVQFLSPAATHAPPQSGPDSCALAGCGAEAVVEVAEAFWGAELPVGAGVVMEPPSPIPRSS